MTTALMEAPDTKAIEREAHAAIAQANAITINDNPSLVAASDVLKGYKTIQKRIDYELDPIIKSQRDALDRQRDLKKKLSEPVEQAERIVKCKIAAYQREQEEIRRAEEIRLREEARKAAEERRLQEAVALEQAGDKRAAEAMIAAPVAPPPVVVPVSTPKIAGVSMRQNWKFRIVDERAIPREYLKADEVKIGGYVRSMKGDAKIPGVEVYCEDVVSSTGL